MTMTKYENFDLVLVVVVADSAELFFEARSTARRPRESPEKSSKRVIEFISAASASGSLASRIISPQGNETSHCAPAILYAGGIKAGAR